MPDPNIRFFSCTESEFRGLATASTPALTAGALYFTTDTCKIYKAESTSTYTEYGTKIIIKTTTGNPSITDENTVCFNAADGTTKVYRGSTDGWVAVGNTTGSSITPVETIGPASGTGAATHSQVPSALAVRNAIEDIKMDSSAASVATNANKVLVLDANGKVPTAYLPVATLSEFVGAFASMSALTDSTTGATTAQIGDFASITGDGTYVLTATPYTTSSNWIKITTYTLPTAASDVLGGVKIGENLSINASGVLSADALTWETISSNP